MEGLPVFSLERTQRLEMALNKGSSKSAGFSQEAYHAKSKPRNSDPLLIVRHADTLPDLQVLLRTLALVERHAM